MKIINYSMKFASLIFIFSVLTIFNSCKNESESHKENNDIENKNVSEAIPSSLFTRVDNTTSGINFINYNKENKDFNYFSYEYFYNGGGVATADFNNDGLIDIVFTANMAPNQLYINKGDFKFENVTKSAGINSNTQDWCTGVTVVDINKDGFQDIFISRSGWFKDGETSKLRNLLYINNGDLTFTEKGEAYGFTDLSRSTQACFFDKDNDGDLDVYMINHPTRFTTFQKDRNGKVTYIDKGSTYSDSDKLYENIGGTYKDVTKALGLVNVSHSLGIKAADLNNDGWQDLYIANDYSKPDDILINQGNGKFKNEKNTVVKHMSKFSMGVDISDINNDGYVDIFNTEMLGSSNYSKKVNMASMNVDLYNNYVSAGLNYQDMHNSLQLNNGNGTFSEISWMANVAETDWSWSPLLADFDNDGEKDLFITNGYKRDVINKDFMRKSGKELEDNPKKFDLLAQEIPESKTYNFMYQNNGDLTFTDATATWGLKGVALNTNGSAYADFDNDGNLDLVLNNLEEPAVIYKNNGLDNNFISLSLKSKSQIPYGAKVAILDKGKEQYQQVSNTSGFQSQSDVRVHFGIGNSKAVDSIVIDWPEQGKKLYAGLAINKMHNVTPESGLPYTPKSTTTTPLLTDVTNKINVSVKHKESEYDDYLKEILLPHKVSQEGPFIGVADVNGDGLDDFFQGNGSGFAGELYIQGANGKFTKSKQPDFVRDRMSEDLGVLFFDYDKDGDKDLYVVSGSNEFDISSPLYHDRLYNNDGKGNFTKTNGIIPAINASGSHVISGDIDGDGDLDLFVGGLQEPGKYPQAGESQLLINNNGVFKNEIISRADGLNRIGMVKDAIFADINNDNQLDLVVVGQWMPVEIYINNGGEFTNKSKEYGTDKNVGWWNSITATDINGDGTLDLIAGNLGMNSKHKASQEEPFVVMAKDFDGNGTNDIALGYYNNHQLYPVRGLQCSSEQIPKIKENVRSYAEFGTQTFGDIYSNFDTSDALTLKATYFKSAYLINENNRFTYTALSNRDQLSPINAILVDDLNNDNKKEIITVGNLFPVEIETGRYDAGIGAVLDSNLQPIPMSESGFFNDQDARDLKSIIINGKKHVMVSNNRSNIEFFALN